MTYADQSFVIAVLLVLMCLIISHAVEMFKLGDAIKPREGDGVKLFGHGIAIVLYSNLACWAGSILLNL
jgi:hypothetical protein